MMIALGLAFRSEPIEAISVVVQSGPGADHASRILSDQTSLIVSTGTEDECRRQLRAGQKRTHHHCRASGGVSRLSFRL